MCNRNATASWSGYLHQGKVGIYVSLKEIHNIIKQQKNTICTNLFNDCYITYENAEDFDICINGYLHSRHQVKAYTNTGNLKSKYTSAINGFDLTGTNSSTSCYLHVIEDISDWDSSGAQIIKDRRVVVLFEYKDGYKYCPINGSIDKLEEYSKELIGNIMGNRSDNDKLKNIFECLLYILDQKIRIEHAKKSKTNYDIKISFKEIYDVIIGDNSIDKHDLHRLRKTFSEGWQKYKIHINTSIPQTQISLADELSRRIYELKDAEFLSCLGKIQPHIDFINNKNLQEDGLKDVFFQSLLKITMSPDFDKLAYIHNSGIYKLSCINRELDCCTEVISGIIDNINKGNLTEDWFLGSSIINRSIDYIPNKIVPSHILGENLNYPASFVSKNDNFLYEKGISLISRDEVIKLLNK